MRSVMTTKQQARSFQKVVLSCFVILTVAHRADPQESAAVVIPHYDDKYSKFVKKLESGETNINYQEFRESLLESNQFKAIGEQKPGIDTLRNTMHELMSKAKYTEEVN